MLEIKNLNIIVGADRHLIKDLSFTLNKGDKLAIVGEEGNGKSTLVKAIADVDFIKNYAKITGHINKKGNKIGYLEQVLNPDWNNQTVDKYFIKETPGDEDDYGKYEMFGKITQVMSKLGLSDTILANGQAIGTLSGGEKIKLQLTKILSREPDILVFDEPTNDLDIKTLQWLENFIKKSNQSVVFISHDETLLENAANCILHMEQLRAKTFNQNTYERIGYREYVDKRLHLLERQEQIAVSERADDEAKMKRWQQIYERVRHEQAAVSRGDPATARLLKKKMKSVKAQEARFERERKGFTEMPNPEEAISFKFSNAVNIHGKKIIADFAWDELVVAGKSLAKNIVFKAAGKEKIAIIGNNGVGKTVFIKALYKDLKDRSDLRIGYMPQNYEEILGEYAMVLDFATEDAESREDVTAIRTCLGSMKFTGDEVTGSISALSGGQKAKLFLAKLISLSCDCLILDEPTRNLSPLSNPMVRKALCNFDGAIIAISHDRKFIEEVANRVIEFTHDGFRDGILV